MVTWASSTPSSSNRSASHGPFWSWIRPVRTSVPVTTMPARVLTGREPTQSGTGAVAPAPGRLRCRRSVRTLSGLLALLVDLGVRPRPLGFGLLLGRVPLGVGLVLLSLALAGQILTPGDRADHFLRLTLGVLDDAADGFLWSAVAVVRHVRWLLPFGLLTIPTSRGCQTGRSGFSGQRHRSVAVAFDGPGVDEMHGRTVGSGHRPVGDDGGDGGAVHRQPGDLDLIADG